MSPARLLATATVAASLVLSGGLVSATAWADAPLAPRTTFDMVVAQADGTVAAPSDGEAIPNIDSVKATIRAYYNATGGVASKTSSRYITQVRAIERQVLASLPATAPVGAAVSFDVDDTLLSNYDFEDKATAFTFDPALNASFVTGHLFPAISGMPQLLADLRTRGYAVYGITGRPASQEPDTIANLTEQGFTTTAAPGGTPLFDAANLYTKDAVVAGTPATIPTQPWVDCAADGIPTACSTVEYKALTRRHIETADNVDILTNVGDQWSDLEGGFADGVKIPNPTYFLASPDLIGAPASDATMVPPTSYVVQPDGSSGYTVASGDDIPNIDPLRKMVRGYYNAPTGVADKASSPYIAQLTALTTTWTAQVSADCTAGATTYRAAVARRAVLTAAVATATKKVAKHTRSVSRAKKRLRKARGAKSTKTARQQLRKTTRRLKANRASLTGVQQQLAASTAPVAPAMVFDADDTTLWNYDLEDGVLKFNYDPATAARYVSGQLFPAVPGMIGMVRAAKTSGCAVFGLTGRPASQQADTVANLAKVGFVDGSGQPLFTSAQFFTRDVANQPWVDCGSDRVCSTVEYKSGTRAHIEDLGFDVVGNVGDQYSDLLGEHADHVYKVPNPTYYLP